MGEVKTAAEEARELDALDEWARDVLQIGPERRAKLRARLTPVFERAQPCRESHAVRDYPDLRRRAEEADALRERAERAEAGCKQRDAMARVLKGTNERLASELSIARELGDDARRELVALRDRAERAEAQVAHLGGACDYSSKVRAVHELRERAESERDEAKRERDELREVWLPADQTLMCAFCGWTGWLESEGPHSWECPIGYMQAMHEAAMADLRAQLAAAQGERDKPYKDHTLTVPLTDFNALRDELARLRVREGQLAKSLAYMTDHYHKCDCNIGAMCGLRSEARKLAAYSQNAPDVLGAVRIVLSWVDYDCEVYAPGHKPVDPTLDEFQTALATLRAAGIIPND